MLTIIFLKYCLLSRTLDKPDPEFTQLYYFMDFMDNLFFFNLGFTKPKDCLRLFNQLYIPCIIH